MFHLDTHLNSHFIARRPLNFYTVPVHRLYLHPLSRFPSPLLAKISNFPHSKSYLDGRQTHNVHALTEKDGGVVQVAPRELSFSSAKPWQDVHGACLDCQPFIKSTLYAAGTFVGDILPIVSERDSAKHHDMRKCLSTAFPERSLKEQEHLIAKIIDHFIERIVEDGPGSIDITI